MSMSTKPLTREDVLGADDIQIEKVDTPEWGGFVYVKEMTGKAREQFEKAYSGKGESPTNMRAQLAAMSICDESGELLFSLEDVEALGDKSASTLILVFDVARKLSALGKENTEELAEEMEENPSSVSASG